MNGSQVTKWVSVRRYLLLCGVLALVGLAGCQNMQIQPKLAEPYDSSPLFGSAAREILPEAVPVGFLNDDELLTNGTVNGELATEFPFPITREILDRGQNQFNAFCAPCHGYSGYGDGVVVEEGFQPAQSFHTEEFRAVPVGRIYQAIAYGSGAMFDYAARVNVEDRWAIVAYIRALQLSQNAAYDDLPTELQSQIDLAGN